jgi:hypothetical protein
MKKEVVIIVAGTKYINSKIPFIKKLLLRLYQLVRNSEPVYQNYAKDYGHKIRREGREIIYLDWDRGFTSFSVRKGKNKLKEQALDLISKGYRVSILGISLGGDIALRVINELKDGDVDKVVLICSVNVDNTMDKERTKFLNIYSSDDLLAEIAIKLKAPIHGGDALEGNSVKNILINGFGHNQFCTDEVIDCGEYKGNRISDLVKDFLDC